MASQIASLTIVYSTVYSGADQRKHQSSASLAFVRGIHRGPVNSPHKWPVTRKMFPFDDVIMRRFFSSNIFRRIQLHCTGVYFTVTYKLQSNIFRRIYPLNEFSKELQIFMKQFYGAVFKRILNMDMSQETFSIYEPSRDV